MEPVLTPAVPCPVTDELEKAERLVALLSRYGRVAVAFSGGVDSAVVAKAARLAVEEAAVAVTAVSPSLASGELEIAREVAEKIGIRHKLLRTDEFERPGYTANAPSRCYYCKTELYDQIARHRDEIGFDVIVNGANLDDRGDHRPGMLAAREHGVLSPLVEAGLGKEEVRRIAKLWGLPVWDKPASPCLSSRIAYGVEVTPERVRRVDLAEQFLREALELRELRVRLEANDLARIEVPVDALPRLAVGGVRETIVSRMRELGFRYVAVDLEGFRSGSLNAAIPAESLVRLT